MKIINLFIILAILSCNQAKHEVAEKKDIYLFNVDNVKLSKNDMRNKFEYPCTNSKTKEIKTINQLPGSQYYFFNENTKKTSFTLQCEEESIIYPVGMGIIIDIERNNDATVFETNHNFKHYFDRMIEEVGYLPDDFKRLLFKNYVMIDHGFYFTEEFRVLSIYSNLSKIPENLEIGMEANQLTELGFINNDGYDLLSTTLFKNEEGNLEVQKNIINLEIIFEKDRRFYYIGEGLSEALSINSFNNIFIQ